VPGGVWRNSSASSAWQAAPHASSTARSACCRSPAQRRSTSARSRSTTARVAAMTSAADAVTRGGALTYGATAFCTASSRPSRRQRSPLSPSPACAARATA
jgi:hypothetical protein